MTMQGHDLNNIELKPAADFGGSEKKRVGVFEGKKYLFKLPDPIREKNNDLSYMNNQFSEYIGSHIFNLLGIKAQDTILGEKNIDGINKILVGCEVFTTNKKGVGEFSDFLNSVDFDAKNGYKNQSIETFELIVSEKGFDTSKFIEQFNDMIVVDCLLVNQDRHFHNIGFETINDVFVPTKIYDCGSCLCALKSDEALEKLLKDDSLFKSDVYNISPPYFYKGQRLKYHELFNEPSNNLKQAINKIYPKIDINSINKLIDDTPYISDIRKTFYKKAILFNYENIIKKSYFKINYIENKS